MFNGKLSNGHVYKGVDNPVGNLYTGYILQIGFQPAGRAEDG